MKIEGLVTLAVSRRTMLSAFAAVFAFCPGAQAWAQGDPLPAWNAGAATESIISLVTWTTTEGGVSFVAPEDRIATFDQDGTTWVEHPLYGQGLFALDGLA
jgi:hypothetical protein